MGVAPPTDTAPLARTEPGSPDDARLFERVDHGLRDKGFFVTTGERLVNWARAGSMWFSR